MNIRAVSWPCPGDAHRFGVGDFAERSGMTPTFEGPRRESRMRRTGDSELGKTSRHSDCRVGTLGRMETCPTNRQPPTPMNLSSSPAIAFES
jgi:hypothetical protein